MFLRRPSGFCGAWTTLQYNGEAKSMPLVKRNNTRGKIAKLCALLREDILHGHIAPGRRLPPQSKLGQQHDMADASVSVVLGRLAHEGLVVRVPGRGSFVAEELPESPDTVIDIVRSMAASDPSIKKRASALALVEEFTRVCSERGMTARWHHLSPGQTARVEDLAKTLGNSRGVIIMSSFGAELARLLWQRGVPAVVLSHPAHLVLQVACYYQITFDRSEAGRLATDHLISCGYKRIAYFGLRGSAGSLLRMRGFLEAAKEHHIQVPTEWFIEATSDNPAELRMQMHSLLERNARPEAICCATDYIAWNLELVALQEGHKVPQDLALVACDTGPEAVQAPVPISTVGPILNEICKQAIDVIQPTKPGFTPADCELLEPIILPLHLAVRDSCSAKLSRVDVQPTGV